MYAPYYVVFRATCCTIVPRVGPFTSGLMAYIRDTHCQLLLTFKYIHSNV